MSLIKKNKTWRFLICIFIFLIIGDYLYTTLTSELPSTEPMVMIKYNDKSVPNKMGEHNWFDPKMGGNSYLAGSSYELGKTVSTFTAKCGEQVAISFSSKPKEMKVLRLIGKKPTDNIAITFGSDKKYSFDLPSEKGQYIFEIVGTWDDFHNTSNVFRVDVE